MGQNRRRELSERTLLRDPLLYLLEGLSDNGPAQQQTEHGTSGWQYYHRRRRRFSSSRMSLQMSAH